MATIGRNVSSKNEAERGGRDIMLEHEECRYRRDLAGFHVCWAASRVGIVTDMDCDRCPVPDTLEEVDCHYLQARVQLVPGPTAEWICGAMGRPVNPEDPTDCSHCAECERASPRRPVLD